jgi:hypothetical protein
MPLENSLRRFQLTLQKGPTLKRARVSGGTEPGHTRSFMRYQMRPTLAQLARTSGVQSRLKRRSTQAPKLRRMCRSRLAMVLGECSHCARCQVKTRFKWAKRRSSGLTRGIRVMGSVTLYHHL